MEKEIVLRPLGKLLNLIDSTGYKVEYQFDDLVFVDNTAFLFRFDENQTENVFLHFNEECNIEAKEKLAEYLLKTSYDEDVKLLIANNFELKVLEETKEFQVIFK